MKFSALQANNTFGSLKPDENANAYLFSIDSEALMSSADE